MLQAVISATADSYLASGGSANTNFGSSDTLPCGRVSSVTARPIFRFPASGLPYFVDVDGTTLAFAIPSGTPTTQNYTVRRVTLDSWAEGTVTWNSPWANAGGDYTSSGEVTAAIDPGEISFGVTDIVAACVEDGANFDFLMFGASTGTNDYLTIAARDHTNALYRPSLTINYTLPPVVERIARSMKRRLALVTTGNGYSTTFNVVRPSRRGLSGLSNGTCVLEQSQDAQKVRQTDGNPCAVEWRQEFYVTIFVAAADDTVTPVDTAANFAAANAELAITTEQITGDWANFDGLAFTSEQTGRNIQFDGDTATVMLTYAITYRTSENDPYTVR
jgi:hypothetical protein